MLYLSILVPKCCRKMWFQYGCGERWYPWEDHTYQDDVHVPPGGWVANVWLWWRFGKRGDITVDRELACPAAPHPRYMAAGACHGPCSGKHHWLWLAWPCLWFWWCPVSPYPLWYNCPVGQNDWWCWHGQK